MSATVTSVWSRLGKPDWDSVNVAIGSLPREVVNKLNISTLNTLKKLLFLQWHHAFHSGRGKAYAWASERYLGEACARSERTIRRILYKLQALGLQTIQRRRPLGKAWQTNIYQPGGTLLAVLYARLSKKAQRFRDRTLLSHKDLKKGLVASEMAATSRPEEKDIASDDPSPLDPADRGGDLGHGGGQESSPRPSLSELVARAKEKLTLTAPERAVERERKAKAYWDRVTFGLKDRW